RQRFVAALPYLQEALSEAVVREGLFAENPAHVRQRYLRAGIALLVLAAAGGLIFGGWLAAYADLAFVPFIGIGILGAALLFLAGGASGPAWDGGPPVVVGGAGWDGGPVWYGGPRADTTPSWGGGHGPAPGSTASTDAGLGHGPSGPGGLQGISDSLDDMLNR